MTYSNCIPVNFAASFPNLVQIFQAYLLMSTDYGLGGPGSNPGRDEIFRPSRLALEPTQSPIKWVPGLSRG